MTEESETTTWNGSPPNGQGMYHWLVNKDHMSHVVAWFDLHEWTAFGKVQSKQEIAAVYNYLAPCDPPTLKEVPMTSETSAEPPMGDEKHREISKVDMDRVFDLLKLVGVHYPDPEQLLAAYQTIIAKDLLQVMMELRPHKQQDTRE